MAQPVGTAVARPAAAVPLRTPRRVSVLDFNTIAFSLPGIDEMPNRFKLQSMHYNALTYVRNLILPSPKLGNTREIQPYVRSLVGSKGNHSRKASPSEEENWHHRPMIEPRAALSIDACDCHDPSRQLGLI